MSTPSSHEVNANGSGLVRKPTILDTIERIGNMLPEPALIFVILTAVVIAASAIGVAVGWEVQPVRPTLEMQDKLDADGAPVLDADGSPVREIAHDERGKPIVKLEAQGDPLKPRSLVSGEGLYWLLSSMLRNFTGLPALGLIFVAMVGIGAAEKFGLFSALMRAAAMATPRWLLTPVIVFIGSNSSVASDAGYVVLPPLAAALYAAVGRSPIAGLAAAFCGVSGGFGAGFFPTAGDGFLAGVATTSAQIIDPSFRGIDATHNLYFKMVSSIVVMFVGWFVTDKIVEPRLRRELGAQASDAEIAAGARDMALTGREKKGLVAAVATNLAVVGVFAAMILVPGAPLHGEGVPTLANGHVPTTSPMRVGDFSTAQGQPGDAVLFTREPRKDAEGVPDPNDPGLAVVASGKPRMLEAPGDRWSQVIVPVIFLAFLLPGCVYGVITGTLRGQKDFIEALYSGIRSIVPVLVIMFFLGQFVNCFTYTGLDRMLAYSGGSLLVQAELPVPLLLALFVLLVVLGDFAMSGMLSKFAVLAPIFIPMFMMVGMSPDLTTAAYRIGDSVVNIITPLNSYLLIILAVFQKYKPGAGLGSQIALMLPYSVCLFIAWTGLLVAWWFVGAPLGTNAPLNYLPPM